MNPMKPPENASNKTIADWHGYWQKYLTPQAQRLRNAGIPPTTILEIFLVAYDDIREDEQVHEAVKRIVDRTLYMKDYIRGYKLS